MTTVIRPELGEIERSRSLCARRGGTPWQSRGQRLLNDSFVSSSLPLDCNFLDPERALKYTS